MGDRLRVPGLFFLALLVSFGTVWAFQRGGHDFDVFYHAWNLVLSGRGAEIYRNSPDRFLYAPGFAWLLSPLGLLPRNASLALWCLAKAGVVGYLASQLAGRARDFGLVALGFLLLARPLLIDFQYGQVNLLILGACVWGLTRHFAAEERSPSIDALAWAALGIAAVAKVFPLPLVLVPFAVPAAGRKASSERLGVFAGVLLVLAIPFFAQGWQGGLELLHGWREALAAKGLPLESHNQSFAAFLRHYFSDEATHVIGWGMIHEKIGLYPLQPSTLGALSVAWTLTFMGILLAWILVAQGPKSSRAPREWIAILVALLILPSHLVWKPYFVFGLPAAVLAVDRARGRPWAQAALALVFVTINLTGFDFIGVRASGYIEAAAAMLWAYLLLLVVTVSPRGSSASRD